MVELDRIGYNSCTALNQILLASEKTGTNCRRIKLHDVISVITNYFKQKQLTNNNINKWYIFNE